MVVVNQLGLEIERTRLLLSFDYELMSLARAMKQRYSRISKLGEDNFFDLQRVKSSRFPKSLTTGFSLHFPKELSYGYLRFEETGKITLGRLRKRSASLS